MSDKPIQNYSDESIRSMTEREAVRKRPEVYFQARDEKAIKHTLIEIVGNSLDEHEAGFGDRIIVKRYKDGAMSVQDFGRGIPMGWNAPEGRYNCELIFEKLNAGAKYDNQAYAGFRVGLNGVGLAITQFTSIYTEVEVNRGGKKYKVSYKNGEQDGELNIEPTSEPNGTFIKWLPDLEVFNTAESVFLPFEFFDVFLTGVTLQSETIRVEFTDEYAGKSKEYYQTDLLDYLKVSSDDFISEVMEFDIEGVTKDSSKHEEYGYKANCQIVFTKGRGASAFFHNLMKVEGGSHERALAYGLSNALQKKGIAMSIYDAPNYLVCFLRTKSTFTSYVGQAKGSISNKGLENVLETKFTDILYKQLEMNDDLLKYFKDVCKVKQKAKEEEAKINKIREKVFEKIEERKYSNKIIIPKKFADCRTKQVSKRELYLVEGDSAFGSVKLARDSDFQAVISGRGKIKNALKDTVSSTLTNEIILGILSILGCGIEIKTDSKIYSSFSLYSLNWDKVIICTDGDVDGFQIRCLYLALFYTFMPTLIKEGKIYIVESPLYAIETGGKTIYAYSDNEKNAIVKGLTGKYKIRRSKGLGENDPDEMWETTMNPETRRLIQVQSTENDNILDIMLGDYLDQRKEVITELFETYRKVL